MKSRLFSIFIYVIWTLFWGFVTNSAISYFDKPVFIETTIGLNQVINWYPPQTLILEPQTNIHVRSSGTNFSIINETGEFICTGKPVEMLPHEQAQPFECEITTDKTMTLNIKGYATIYTTSQSTTFSLEKYDRGVLPILAFAIPATILGVSLIMGVIWLFQPGVYSTKSD